MIIKTRPPKPTDAIPFSSTDKMVYACLAYYADGSEHWQLHYISVVQSYWERGHKCPWTNNKKDLEKQACCA